MMTDSEVELEQLTMKDNHKATKFFIYFYRLASLLQYNDKALYWRAYLALLKRIKDEMVHFDKPCSLDKLWDIIQKIDQCYWKWKGELSWEISLAPKQEVKNDQSNKSSPNPIRIRLAHTTQTWTQTPTPTWKRRRSPRLALHSQRRMTSQTNSVRTINSPPRNANTTLTTSFV